MIQQLKEHGCNVEAGIRRFLGKEYLYCRCLKEFLKDSTMQEAEEAYLAGDSGTAMEKVHMLKGSCGNLEFARAYEITCQMMDLHRAGKTREAMTLMPELRREYDIIIDILRKEE